VESFLLVIIFIAAGMSLLSYVYCWIDILGGSPHIISLRQITAVMDRERLNLRFGPPDASYRYALDKPQLAALIRSRRGFFAAECTADALCLLGAWLYMGAGMDDSHIGWFILLAGLCQGINVGWSLWQVRKWAHQIVEEMDNSH
jgi:hypothetical protein